MDDCPLLFYFYALFEFVEERNIVFESFLHYHIAAAEQQLWKSIIQVFCAQRIKDIFGNNIFKEIFILIVFYGDCSAIVNFS